MLGSKETIPVLWADSTLFFYTCFISVKIGSDDSWFQARTFFFILVSALRKWLQKIKIIKGDQRYDILICWAQINAMYLRILLLKSNIWILDSNIYSEYSTDASQTLHAHPSPRSDQVIFSMHPIKLSKLIKIQFLQSCGHTWLPNN